jgi:4-hydroxybenzoate polyprenyltransferase
MTKFQTYAQLVRLPNVFTALADIALAALACGALAGAGAWPAFVLLLLASACLYCGGMVLNDFFDVEQDREERPFRPLPSGRVKPTEALRLGAGLLAGGVLLAGLAGWLDDPSRWTPFVLAGILSGAILLYDGWLKRTWAGPLGMGMCRFLNVLLGLTVMPGSIGSWGLVLALAVGVYIVGVTWFARTEARASNQEKLLLAAGVMLAGLLLAIPLPALAANRAAPVTTSKLFLFLLVGYGFAVGIPAARAIERPSPPRVQVAVKTAVLGLVAFDAILATALAGAAGLVILVLLPPALYLGRWIYST